MTVSCNKHHHTLEKVANINKLEKRIVDKNETFKTKLSK